VWRLLLKGFACCLHYGCENAAHSLFLSEQIKDTFHASGDEIKYEWGVSVPGELPHRAQPRPLCLLRPACADPMVGRCCQAPTSPARPRKGPATFPVLRGCFCTGAAPASRGRAVGHAAVRGSQRVGLGGHVHGWSSWRSLKLGGKRFVAEQGL